MTLAHPWMGCLGLTGSPLGLSLLPVHMMAPALFSGRLLRMWSNGSVWWRGVHHSLCRSVKRGIHARFVLINYDQPLCFSGRVGARATFTWIRVPRGHSTRVKTYCVCSVQKLWNGVASQHRFRNAKLLTQTFCVGWSNKSTQVTIPFSRSLRT